MSKVTANAEERPAESEQHSEKEKRRARPEMAGGRDILEIVGTPMMGQKGAKSA